MIRFGTDGVRGPAGHWPITAEGALRAGRAAAQYARSLGSDRVLIARDTRPSGPGLEGAVIAGVSAEGLIALRGGILPTAAVAIAVDAGIAQVGVQITASHNPVDDNGFKMIGPRGRKLGDETIAQMEQWMSEEASPGPMGEVVKAGRVSLDAWARVAEAAIPEPERFAGRRIALDAANGAGIKLLPWLKETIPAEWVIIGSGGVINDRVGSEHPEALCAAVQTEGCMAGIALDGDGDRCVLVDERGQRVPGDALTWLLATGLGVDALAVTVMSNGALESLLPGVRVHRTAVGDRHLREAMDAQGLVLGAEESGHVLFGEIAGGDGLLTGLRALSYALEQPLSAAIEPYRPLPRRQSKVRVSQRPELSEVASLQKAIGECKPHLGAGGRIFIRYSGTEPVLRILVEGEAAAIGPVMQAMEDAAREGLA